MSNFTIWDATAAASMPLDPSTVNTPAKALAAHVGLAAYMDGDFAEDWHSCLAKYPELAKLGRIISIASRADSVATFMDYEPHNPLYGNPDAVAEWVLSMLDEHQVYLPGAYADQSDMPAIQAAYVRHRVPRAKTSLWLAAPGHAPQPFLDEGFDMVQDRFASKFDHSTAKAHIFEPAVPPKPPGPKPKHSVLVTFTGHQGGAHLRRTATGWKLKPDHGGDWTKVAK